MALVEPPLLGGKPPGLDGVLLVPAPALALVVGQLGVGGPGNPVPRVPHPQAEVHVVEGHRELFVQPAHLVPDGGFDQQAGPGHGGKVLDGGRPEQIAAAAPGAIFVAVARVAPEPGDDPRVLDGVVGVVEHGPADRRASRVGAGGQQLGEPVGIADFHVVVEEQQVLPLCLSPAEVVDGREVEPLPGPDRHPQPGIPPRRLPVIGEGLRVGGVVLDDDYLEPAPPGLFVNGRQTLLKVGGVVLVGNQDADQRLPLDLPLHPVGAGEQPVGGLPFPPRPGQMPGDGPLGRGGHIGLCLRPPRGGPGVYPPVIEHLGQMGRAAVFFNQPEKQVVVLAAVAGRVLPAHRLEQVPPEDRQMADVVAAEEIVGGEVGLEVGRPRAADVLFKEGLVAVQKAVRLPVRPQVQDSLPHLGQGVGGQNVVVVGQRQIFPLRQSGGGVGVGGNPPVFDFFVYDSLILLLIFPDGLPHLGVPLVRSVGQAELAVGGGLVQEGVQKGPQVLRRRVAEGGQDADDGQAAGLGGLARVFRPLGRQAGFGGQIPGFFGEKAAADKPRPPPGHDGKPFFPGQLGRIPGQLARPPELLVHPLASFVVVLEQS